MDEERTAAIAVNDVEARPEPTMPLRHKIVLAIVLAVSVWHIGAIVTWMSPASFSRDRLFRITRKYVRITKSDQFWAMFAPEPLSINRRMIVRAEIDGGETREADLTGAANQAMRSLSFERVGKRLKAHDRLLGGDEPQYLRGFALHTCDELSKSWGTRVRSVTLFREYRVLNIDVHSFKTTRSNPDRVNIGTYTCVE